MSQRARATHVSDSPQRPTAFALALLLVASVFSAALGLQGSAYAASAQVGESTVADAVPADAVLFMEVDLDRQSDQWTTTFDLLERAGLSDLLEEEADTTPEEAAQLSDTLAFTGKAGVVLTSVALEAGADVDDISSEASSLTTDPLSVAEGGVPEGFAIVFQPEDPYRLYPNMESILEDGAEENLATVETTDYNGVTIQYWEAEDEFTDPQAIARVEDYVVFSTSPTDIEPIIDTVNGDVDALSGAESFTAVQNALTTDALVFGYVNSEDIIEAALAQDPSLAEDPTLGDSLEQFSGYAGWSLFADVAGFRLDTIQIPSEGAALPQLTPFEPTLAERVSADSLYFVNSSNLAGTGIFDLLGISLQQAMAEDDAMGLGTPEAVATPTVDEVYEQLEGQLGFNIKTELFDQLTGEYGLALTAADVFGSEPQVDAVFVSEVEDETTVADVADKVSFIFSSAIEEEGAEFATRDVDGGSVTSITIPDEAFPVTVEYGVINGELLIGVNNGIDEYLNGPTEPLADDAVYQDTLAALPQENVTGIQYINLGALLPLIEEAATTMSGSTELEDADPACADYATQEEAQAAYDADDVENWMLDLDFDGVACEDFFAADSASPEASPAGVTAQLNLLSIGSVSYSVDGNVGTSTILLIGE